jgi:AraC-like DNA-binding protein
MQTSTIQVKAFLEAVELAGTASDAVLAAVDFDERRLEREHWVAFGEFEELLRAGLELTRDPALGLHWGERSSMMRYGAIAPLVANARTLRVAVADMQRFTRIVSERPPIQLAETGSRATLYLAPPPRRSPYLHVLAEVSLVGFLRVLQYFGGGDTTAFLISFTHARPQHVNEYIRIFGANLRFDQDVSGIEFDRPLLDRPQPYADAELYRALEMEAERALSRATGDNIADRVRGILTRASPGSPGVREVAAELGVSERSLRRRLADEKTSYSVVLNEVRAATARALLARCSTQETAFEMGFSSANALHRAFRRWTGQSPAEFRRGLAAAGSDVSSTARGQ